MAVAQPTLADQIRAQGGDWSIQGIDRAQELADILAKNGITDLSQLKLNSEQYQQMNGSGENPADPTTATRNWMTYGDKSFGTLAREGWDTTAKRGLSMTDNEGDNILARSVAGKGAVTYHAIPGPDGRVQIVPRWESSGSEDAIKKTAMLAALATGVGALGNAGMLGTYAAEAGLGALGGAGTGAGVLAGNADKAALFGDLGYGAGMTGAQTAAYDAALAGGTGGVGSGVGALAGNADKAALFGNSGYGAGMTGAETAAYDAALGGATTAPSINPADYSHEGLNYPTSASTQPGGPLGGAPGSVTSGIPSLNMSDPSLLSKFGEWAAANPKLATQLAGLAGGALFGDKNKNTGGGAGANPQANFTANKPAAIQRKYIAPPPGYRPGFDPEHTYFTGIGALGTGS